MARAFVSENSFGEDDGAFKRLSAECIRTVSILLTIKVLVRKGGFRKDPFVIFRVIYNLTSKIAFPPVFMRLPNVAILEPSKTLGDSFFSENGITRVSLP